MIYVASPFTHKNKAVEEDRYHDVMLYTASLIIRDIVAFSPIVHCYPMHIKYNLPGHAVFWKRYNETFLARSSSLHVLKLDGWEESKGLNQEIYFAKRKTIPIFYIEGNGLWRENLKIG